MGSGIVSPSSCLRPHHARPGSTTSAVQLVLIVSELIFMADAWMRLLWSYAIVMLD